MTFHEFVGKEAERIRRDRIRRRQPAPLQEEERRARDWQEAEPRMRRLFGLQLQEAAYYAHRNRGDNPGGALDDWVTAEHTPIG